MFKASVAKKMRDENKSVDNHLFEGHVKPERPSACESEELRQKIWDKPLGNLVESEEKPKCQICAKTFARLKSLKWHLKNIHKTTYDAAQSRPNESIGKYNSLQEMMTNEDHSGVDQTMSKTFQLCPKAKATTPTRAEPSLTNHTNICPLCQKPFYNRRNVKRHLKSIHGCGSSFSRHSGVLVISGGMEKDKNHENLTREQSNQGNRANGPSTPVSISIGDRFEHASDNSAEATNASNRFCQICQKTFATNYGLYRHLKEVHRNEKRGNRQPSIESVKSNLDQTETVNESINSSTNIFDSGHLEISSDNKAEMTNVSVPPCELCQKSFSQECHLHRHLKEVDGNEKHGNKLTSIEAEKYNLDQNEMDIESINSSSDIIDSYHLETACDSLVGMTNVSVVSCQLCQKTFSQQCNLHRHLKEEHGNEKCDNKLTPMESEKSNSDETETDKESLNSSSTIVDSDHLETAFDNKTGMTNVSTPSCQICHNTFSRRYSLQRHLKEVHRNEKHNNKLNSGESEKCNFDPTEMENNCWLCNKDFADKHKLLDHLKSCPENKNQYQTSSTSTDHYDLEKEPGKDECRFKCNLCQEMLESEMILAKHLKKIHLIEKYDAIATLVRVSIVRILFSLLAAKIS